MFKVSLFKSVRTVKIILCFLSYVLHVFLTNCEAIGSYSDSYSDSYSACWNSESDNDSSYISPLTQGSCEECSGSNSGRGMWTRSKDKRLLSMCNDQKSFEAIAEVLNRTADDVANRFFDL
jgi:hypothetical protein